MAKKKAKNKYSIPQRARYHKARNNAPSHYGIARNGNKHMYSRGYCDALDDVNDRRKIKRRYGITKANSYTLGHYAGDRSKIRYFR